MMKDNREFLQGIYEKANMLEEEKCRKYRLYKNFLRFSSVAALMIVIPLILIKMQVPQSNIPSEIAQNAPKEIRMFTTNDPVSNFTNAEFIVIGRTKEVSKGSPDNTFINLTIGIDEVFLGNIDKEIDLKVSDFLNIDFKKNSRNLLFLYRGEENIYYLIDENTGYFKEREKDVFQDNLGNLYNTQDIKDNIKRRDLN